MIIEKSLGICSILQGTLSLIVNNNHTLIMCFTCLPSQTTRPLRTGKVPVFAYHIVGSQ